MTRITMKPDRTFTLNSEKLRKHFIAYCESMGMDSNQWNSDIHTYQVMMEGHSPKSLRAIFTNRNTGKQLIFTIGIYYGKYEIHKIGI